MSENWKFITFTHKNAFNHLNSVSEKEVRNIARHLGMKKDWVCADFRIPGNKKDLIGLILRSCHRPYHFLRKTLERRFSQKNKLKECATKMSCEKGYWLGSSKLWKIDWLKSTAMKKNFDSVVHFVQRDNGTGVNIKSDGLILTCAHVVCNDDDDENGVIGTSRIGRKKIVMFPNGEHYICRCVSVIEKRNGKEDLALMKIEEQNLTLPFSKISKNGPGKGCEMVCIGNPCNLDLERGRGNVNFKPPTWHISKGKYLVRIQITDDDVFIKQGESTVPGLGGMKHNCWTYWGHSGAPIYSKSEFGIVGIHNSWDDSDGTRHAIAHNVVKKFVDDYFAGKTKKKSTTFIDLT